MTYTTYTAEMLAAFTGRPKASFPTFVTASAIPQALLLFKMGTCLASPDDLTDDQKQLVDFAIMSMADAIHLSQPYQTALASPFNSESIGSYSYSKVAKKTVAGEATGIEWFDLAVDKLSVCDDMAGFSFGGGIEVFEHDGMVIEGSLGNMRLLAPQDIEQSRFFGFDPAPTSVYGA